MPAPPFFGKSGALDLGLLVLVNIDAVTPSSHPGSASSPGLGIAPGIISGKPARRYTQA
jgi:hypothetical protein